MTCCITTEEFWRKHQRTMPIMYKCANHLLSMPASSAFIERYFSICGVVCKKRAGNMTDDLIIMRSFLKTNMRILDSLNSFVEDE